MEFFERIGSFDHLVLAFSPGALGLGPLAGVCLADIKGAFDGNFSRTCSPFRRRPEGVGGECDLLLRRRVP